MHLCMHMYVRQPLVLFLMYLLPFISCYLFESGSPIGLELTICGRLDAQ